MLDIWEILGIMPTRDIDKIRKAYAALSKRFHPEIDQQGFRRLYDAYQAALQQAKNSGKRPVMRRRVIAEISSGTSKDEYKRFSNLENNQENQENYDIEIEKKQSEASYNYGDLIRRFQQSEAEERRKYETSGALADFICLFKDKEKSVALDSWRNYFTGTVFLQAQYGIKFMKYLIEYLKEQKLFPSETLPEPLFMELCCVYGIMVESKRMEEDLTEGLLKILELHNNCSKLVDKLTKEKEWKARTEAWRAYRSILTLYFTDPEWREKEAWKRVLGQEKKEANEKTGQKKSPVFYELLGVFIQNASNMSLAVYDIFYTQFECNTKEHSYKSKLYKPVYDALNVIATDEFKNFVQNDDERIEQVKILITRYKKLYQPDDSNPDEMEEAIRSFFESELFQALKYSKEMISQFTNCYKNRSNIPYSIWKETYQIYLGRDIAFGLLLFMEYGSYQPYVYRYQEKEEFEWLDDNKNNKVQSWKEKTEDKFQCPGIEITDPEERKEWLVKNFFYSGLTEIWSCAAKSSMRVPYKERILGLLQIAAEQLDFCHDMMSDGILWVYWRSEVIFYYNQDNRCVIMSKEEFFEWMKGYTSLYLSKYFCLSSEKEQFRKSLEALKCVIFGEG